MDDKKLTKLTERELDLLDEPRDISKYRPNKKERAVRKKVYDRYSQMANNSERADAEADWEIADKEYRMYVSPREADDWRADLHLPDSFAAIQTQLQETVDRKSRPALRKTEESDEPLEEFGNSVLNYNMDTTDYDYQYYLARAAAASRGTSFLYEYWRLDKRVVKDPTSVDEDGKLEYQDKEVIDCDDTYTEWIPNEYVYIDEKCLHINDAVDGIRREILHINEFYRIYDGFDHADLVTQGGDISTRSFFQMPADMGREDVEVLHYYNKSIDAYWVVANNVVIHIGPIPFKHKQLPFAVLYQYRVPGRFWGLGIPKLIHYLSEERRTIRNLNLDRQKMNLTKMFLHNRAFDIDEEETTMRMGGIISIDTNGQPINQAIQELSYGDTPPSYFRTEEIIQEDIRRGTGIDDRITVSNQATTATQAAIVKESTLKRVNMIATLAEMDTVKRIGMLKWSNIQFFYPIPRIERITQDNQEKEEKHYKTIVVNGKKFEIVDEDGNKKLRMSDVKGASAIQLKGGFTKYLNRNFDVIVDAAAYTPPSKALQQTKVTETFSLLLSNPITAGQLDPQKSVQRVLSVNNERPQDWMKGEGYSPGDMMMLAESENMVMSSGQPLAGTEGATEEHTLVHLMYTKTTEFSELPDANKQLISDHILQEHDANPATGSAADLLGQPGAIPGAVPAAPQMNPMGISADTSQPQTQVADIQPTNFAVPE